MASPMSAGKNLENVLKFKVAHVKLKGVDVILVPLDSSFGQLTRADQQRASQALQHYAAAAGLKGSLVPIWDRGTGTAEFLAEKQLHPILQNLSLFTVQQSINRELSIKGANVAGHPLNLARQGGSEPAQKPVAVSATPATIHVASDQADCQVFVDGSFVGNNPAKVRVSEGSHVVEVKKEGFETFRQEVQISAGSEFNLRAQLKLDSSLVDPFAETMTFDSMMQNRGKVAAFQRKHRVGLVTLLFTDMVGSTKLKQELGDREAVRVMQVHHSEVRDLLRKYPGGEEISTAGDSFFLVFAKPSEAVKFSLQLQSRLREWSKQCPVRVKDRVGIHVGEVFIEELEGSGGKVNDLYGIQVDSAARVMSLADGDQILMTRFAFDNARQVLKGQVMEGVKELSWKNHGLFQLKGVEEPLEICEVGEIGCAVLRAPADSDKVHRFSGSEGETAHSALRANTGHVVVSTKTSIPLKPLRISPVSPAKHDRI